MTRWNEWTRKRKDGWVERRRRFRRLFAERFRAVMGQEEPAVVGVTIPGSRATDPNRGER